LTKCEFYVLYIAMKESRVHLEIQKYRHSYCGLLRTTYWDKEEKKYKHKSFGRMTGLSHSYLKSLQALLRGDARIVSSEKITVSSSKEYGASCAVLQLANDIGLDKVIYSKPEQQWVKDCLAMIVGRLVYAGSKLSLSNRHRDTELWNLCGVEGAVDVKEHCYKSMDRLLGRQKAIQQKLAAKHFDGNALVLYDITSSYFEGEYSESEIVKFGYNRDRKRGKEQIVIGLICTSQGCPIGIEVFAGNTKDETTVIDKIREIQNTYKVKEIIFVGDRGMITKSNLDKIKDTKGLNTISALTHPQIKELLAKRAIQIDMFDENSIVEIIDPEDRNKRYCLCRNNGSAQRESKAREALLTRTVNELTKISLAKRKASAESISARVGKLLAKTKMGKFIEWKVCEGKLTWLLKEDTVDTEQMLDGCYIISSDVPAKNMAAQEIVDSYKKLTLVEKAFRNLKTVQLEIRPVYHKTDDRIRCHAFVCMLAYYLQWHMTQRLQPLFAADGKSSKRFWTFENVIERLKSVRKEKIAIDEASYFITTKPDRDQQAIAKLLNIKL
jgi:transposase